MKTIFYCVKCGNLFNREDANLNQNKCDCSIIHPRLMACKVDDTLYTPEMHTPRTQHGFTIDAYKYIWDKYVQIPTNKQFKQSSFNKLQAKINNELLQSANEIEKWKKIKKLKKAKYLGEQLTDEELKFIEEHDAEKRRIQYLSQQHLFKSASCPKCGSQSITTMKKGFGIGKAAAGVVLTGDVTGALAGGIGANKVVNVCQNCGHQWEPGK